MMKLFALSVSLLLATQASASTTPLSQSPTFLGLQNRVSTLETSTARIGTKQVFQSDLCAGNNSAFCLSQSGNGPYVNFASNDLLAWNPTASQFEFDIDNTTSPKFTIGRSSANANVPLSVANSVSVTGGATSFYLGLNGTGNRPFVAFDGFNSRIEFGSSGAFIFYVGGRAVGSLDGNGTMKIRGTISQNQTVFP